jgi:hypothetical protein
VGSAREGRCFFLSPIPYRHYITDIYRTTVDLFFLSLFGKLVYNILG